MKSESQNIEVLMFSSECTTTIVVHIKVNKKKIVKYSNKE